MRLLLLTLIGLSFSCCLSAQGDTLLVPYENMTLTIDGNTEDWPDEPPTHFFVHNLHTGDTNQVSVQAAWTENQLYLAVEVLDRHLIKLRSGVNNPTLNLGDAVEIYIDPHNDSKTRMDVNDYQFIIDVGGDYVIFKGDKTFIREGYQTPKDTGLATIAFDYKVVVRGTINQQDDLDSGYTLELAIPWAALGVHPHEGMLFRLDICVDDMDELVLLENYSENSTILSYSFSSWQGDTTFGFPDRWRVCRLLGGPNALTKMWRSAGRLGFFTLGAVALCSLGLLFYIWKTRHKATSDKKTVPEEEPAKELPATLPVHPVFSELHEFILKKVDQDISPDDLARHCNTSLRNLQRLFQEELAMSPHTFITRVKMEKALALLQDGFGNVSEVAYAVGYADPAYFSKVFKKYFHKTPSEWLKSRDKMDARANPKS